MADVIEAGKAAQGESDGVRWSLSADHRKIRLEKDAEGGVLSGTFSWAFEPGVELIGKAITGFANREVAESVGDKLRMRKIGPVVFDVNTGPPTWWYPRIQIKVRPRLSFRVGWLRLAVGIWLWGKDS